jgi:AraC-like DNA-binding protein
MTTSAPPRTGLQRSAAVPTGRCSPTVAFSVVDEVDRYTKSIAGVEIEAVRNGDANGANTVLTVREPRFTMTAADVRMPLLSRTTVGDDQVVMTYIRAASPGNRWCGIDLEAGSLLVYGPSAEHTAITRPGLAWTCAITDADRLAAVAEQLGTPIEPPPRGAVWEIPRSGGSQVLGTALRTLAESAAGPSDILDRPSDDMFRAMVLTLAGTEHRYTAGGGRGIDSRQVTTLSIDYANAIGRVPSLSELCIAAHVSERRLRKAFVDEYKVPPARFFRTWALAEARRRLVDNDPTHHSVADVATGLGFFHLGRFASYYKRLYGEPPSTTLRVRE